MDTFCAVDDKKLVSLIRQARKHIEFVAPGLHLCVANALCKRFDEIQHMEVTIILDPSEDVVRIGFGELAALRTVHDHATASGFYVRSQPGLRMGVLRVDDLTLVWSPTPRSVEAPPTSGSRRRYQTQSPNGLMLGPSVGSQISKAICAEGTETNPQLAEIGTQTVTPQQIALITNALALNPPIPVDLARITRVFSTKLQFVELQVSHTKLSQQEISLSGTLLNADASPELQGFLESKLRPYSEFKDRKVLVPVYVDGKRAFDRLGNGLLEAISEASLNRERRAIEAEYLYDIAGFGRVIESARRSEFDSRLEAYSVRLQAHARSMNETVANEAFTIVDETVRLIGKRISESNVRLLNTDAYLKDITSRLEASVKRATASPPRINLVFKNITFEQTQDTKFRAKLDAALPPAAKRRLRDWYDEFSAAPQSNERRILPNYDVGFPLLPSE